MRSASWCGGDALRRNLTLPLPTDPMSIQLENRGRWNEAREKNRADFYTIGYAGRSIEDVVHVLCSAGVVTLVDIRHIPVSQYKPDFSKNNLERHMRAAGIGYVHLPDLGIPRDIRSLAIGKPDRSELWEWYDRHVVNQFVGRNLHRFFNFADHPIALMCMEADPTSCHRHRLALALEEMGLQGYDL